MGGVGPRALPSAKVGPALWADGLAEFAPKDFAFGQQALTSSATKAGAFTGKGVQLIPNGVAIYCEWETSESEWAYFQEHFLKGN